MISNLFYVSGDPCKQPQKIPSRAPEVKCKNGRLEGAFISDNGYIVIGMLQTKNTRGRNAENYSGRCESRREGGYRWGMGKIFLRVANITRID